MKSPVSNGQPLLPPPPKALLIVLSGPSGVGKDAVLSRMKACGYPLKYVTTTTTRLRRPNETDGKDYHFASKEKFQGMIKNNELLEWAEVYGNWYGIPKSEVEKPLEAGEDVIVKIDIQGAATIRKNMPQAVTIFLAPTSIDDLRVRLKQRHTESPSEFALRLKVADDEMKQVTLFDYVVINKWDKLDQAVADITGIIRAEKCRVVPRDIDKLN